MTEHSDTGRPVSGDDLETAGGAPAKRRIEDWLAAPENGYRGQKRTALESLEAGGGARPAARDLALRVEEAPLRGVVLLRAALDRGAVRDALAPVFLDMGLPEGAPEPGGVAAPGEIGALRLEPDRMLLLTSYEDAPALAAALDAALTGHTRLVEPVSDGWSGFQIVGLGVREALAKGVAADFHPAVFKLGALRRGAIGPVDVVVYPLEGEPERFEVLCRRSQATALHRWLLGACAAGSLPEIFPEADTSR